MKDRRRQVGRASPAAKSGNRTAPSAQSTENTGLRLKGWVSDPEPCANPLSVSGNRVACKMRLASTRPLDRSSGGLVRAGVTRYQWPSNIPVVDAHGIVGVYAAARS